MAKKLELGKVTLGTASIRGGAPLLDALVASGYGQVDTSNNYEDGDAERALGEAIRRAGGLPAGTEIFTKVDVDPVTGAFDGDRVLRSYEESLERLGLDRVPVLHLHDPYMLTLSEAMAPGGPVEALVRLRDEGAVDAIGVAMGTETIIEEYLLTEAFDAILSHNRYTVLDRSSERIMDLATERDMLVFNAAPFGGGILAGKNDGEYGYNPVTPEFMAYIDAFRRVCADHGVAVPAAALHFSLRDPRIDSTVVGVYTVERLAALDALVQAEIPEAFWAELAALGTPPASTVDYR